MLAALLTLALAADPVDLQGAPFRDFHEPLTIDLHGVKATLRASVSLRAQSLPAFASGVDGIGFIDWRWPSSANTDGLTITFSRAVSVFSLEAGDWGSDDDGPLELTAWSCDHQLLATVKKDWDITRNPPFEKLRVQAKDICSVRYRSGGSFAGSTFITKLAAE
jgi:hypothetical protein